MRNRLSIPLLLDAALSAAGCTDNAEQVGADDAATSMPTPANDTMAMDMAAPNPADPPATQGYKKSMNDMLSPVD